MPVFVDTRHIRVLWRPVNDCALCGWPRNLHSGVWKDIRLQSIVLPVRMPERLRMHLLESEKHQRVLSTRVLSAESSHYSFYYRPKHWNCASNSEYSAAAARSVRHVSSARRRARLSNWLERLSGRQRCASFLSRRVGHDLSARLFVCSVVGYGHFYVLSTRLKYSMSESFLAAVDQQLPSTVFNSIESVLSFGIFVFAVVGGESSLSSLPL